MEYQALQMMLKTARDASKGKPIANNTRLVRDGDAIAIRLHETNVVTFHNDGSVTLNSGGWRTVTTKDRMNAYAPCRVYSDRGTWYIATDTGSYVYADGIKIYADGLVTGQGDESIPAIERKLKKQINAYAKEFTRKLYVLEIPAPSNGDCWGCLMKATDGTHPMGGKDHILAHLEDRYFVPSLLVNALNVWGSPAARFDAAALMGMGQTPDDVKYTFGMQDQIRRAIVKWCKREVGLS